MATRRKQTKKKTVRKTAPKTNGTAAKIQVTDADTRAQFEQLTLQVNAAKIKLADAEMARMAALTRLSQAEGARHALAESVGKGLLGEESNLAGWTFLVDTLEFVRNATQG